MSYLALLWVLALAGAATRRRAPAKAASVKPPRADACAPDACKPSQMYEGAGDTVDPGNDRCVGWRGDFPAELFRRAKLAEPNR